jgi:regulatory protein
MTETAAVYERALRLLTARGYAEKELRQRLLKGGAEPHHVDAVIERLTASGLLNDAAYARAFTRSRVRSRGASARRVKQELWRHGVAADIVAEAVEEVFADEAVDEAAVVEQLARRRAVSLTGLEPAVQRRRLYGYLARRGYDANDVRRAVEAVLGGQ